MASQVFIHLWAIFACIVGANAWRCAKYKHYFSQQPDYIECLWDCCGNSFNRHCCAPIGIIVGCAIVGSVVVAALVIILVCWYQRRRARHSKGLRLFHNRRHSHYPVAPTSVIRPAPPAPPYRGPPPSAGYGPGGPGYRGPPHPQAHGYYPPMDQYYDSDREKQGYRPPARTEYNEKPPLPSSDFDSDRDESYRRPHPRAGPPQYEKPPKSDVFI